MLDELILALSARIYNAHFIPDRPLNNHSGAGQNDENILMNYPSISTHTIRRWNWRC